MAKKKEKRVLGKKSGYAYMIRGDEIKISSELVELMNTHADEVKTLSILHDHAMEYCKEELNKIVSGKRVWWETIFEDLGLDMNEQWVLRSNILTKKPLPDKKTACSSSCGPSR